MLLRSSERILLVGAVLPRADDKLPTLLRAYLLGLDAR